MSGVWHGHLMGARKLGSPLINFTLIDLPPLNPTGGLEWGRGRGSSGSFSISISIGLFFSLFLGMGNRLWYIDSGGEPMLKSGGGLHTQGTHVLSPIDGMVLCCTRFLPHC